MNVSLIMLSIMGLFFSISVAAEVSTVKRISVARADLRFMKNYDERIRSLEDYSVTYSDGTNFHKFNSAHRAARGGDLNVNLIRRK
jgi:hypothetical protein